MPFLLIFSDGSNERAERYNTEPEAVIRACALIAQGGYGGFRVEDETGKIATNEAQIRNRCKQTRMP